MNINFTCFFLLSLLWLPENFKFYWWLAPYFHCTLFSRERDRTGKLPSETLSMTLRSPLGQAPFAQSQAVLLIGHTAIVTLVSEGPATQHSPSQTQFLPMVPAAGMPFLHYSLFWIIHCHPKCPLGYSSERWGNDSACFTGSYDIVLWGA